MIRHYEEARVHAMASNVFQSRRRSPGTKVTRAENVARAARALRRTGVDVLQDVPVRRPSEIDTALRRLPGVDETTVRMFLMYTGLEDFVPGDAHVRRFVASAVGKRAVSAPEAEALVRDAAHELLLSPRLLDHEIWKYGVTAAGVARPPAPSDGS